MEQWLEFMGQWIEFMEQWVELMITNSGGLISMIAIFGTIAIVAFLVTMLAVKSSEK